jgi:hypothetical protein
MRRVKISRIGRSVGIMSKFKDVYEAIEHFEFLKRASVLTGAEVEIEEFDTAQEADDAIQTKP